ncbi:MAG: hypothetical protein WAO58_07495 [Fimbriimonadaceae bacterium]
MERSAAYQCPICKAVFATSKELWGHRWYADSGNPTCEDPQRVQPAILGRGDPGLAPGPVKAKKLNAKMPKAKTRSLKKPKKPKAGQSAKSIFDYCRKKNLPKSFPKRMKGTPFQGGDVSPK